MPLHDLSGKIVLITGIGCVGEGWGNGITIATLFARQGAILYGCDLNLDAANRAAKQIEKDEEAAKHPARKQRDILVNNVGKSEPGGPAEMSEEVWDAQTDVNLKSVYLMCHLVLPIIEKQESSSYVLNISSVAGLRYIGKPQVAYAATKAAIIQFTKTTAVIYAQRIGGKVRLNTVVPGLINTPLVSVLAKNYAGGDEAGFRKTRDAQVPTGRMGTAWDVAHAGLFLCSSEASYVTRQEIVVDGAITDSTGRT